MKARMSMITLGVSDLARSRRFYAEGLGLPLRPESVGVEDGDIAFFDFEGTWLTLWERAALAEDAGLADNGDGFVPFSISHNVASREDVDALVELAEIAGAVVTKRPSETFYGGYAGYFADPDGFLWEIAWNPWVPELLGEQ